MLQAGLILKIDELVHVKKSFFVPSIMLIDPFVMEWYKTTSALMSHPSNWDNQHLAIAICGFAEILAKTRAQIARIPANQPLLIKHFLSYMSDVAVAVELLKITKISGPKRYGNQPIGNLIQDSNLEDVDTFPLVKIIAQAVIIVMYSLLVRNQDILKNITR